MGPFLKRNEDFFAVFDGHGGSEVSNYLAQNLDLFLAEKELNEKSFLEIFREANNEILEIAESDSGSTSVVIYIVDNTMHIASCGDSRAIMGKETRQYER